MQWPKDAEDYCLKEAGVVTIIHQNRKGTFDVTQLPKGKDTLIALFDNNGFLIIRISKLREMLNSGYIPNGISRIDGYLSKLSFEWMSSKASYIRKAVERAGKWTLHQYPDRSASDDIINVMAHKWEMQNHHCYICNSIIDPANDEGLLTIARGMRDATKKSYDLDNLIIGHYGCILAKNAFPMEEVYKWKARFMEGTIHLDDKTPEPNDEESR